MRVTKSLMLLWNHIRLMTELGSNVYLPFLTFFFSF